MTWTTRTVASRGPKRATQSTCRHTVRRKSLCHSIGVKRVKPHAIGATYLNLCYATARTCEK